MIYQPSTCSFLFCFWGFLFLCLLGMQLHQLPVLSVSHTSVTFSPPKTFPSTISPCKINK